MNSQATSNVEHGAVEAFVACMTEQSYPGNPFPHKNLYSTQNKDRVVHAIAHAVGL